MMEVRALPVRTTRRPEETFPVSNVVQADPSCPNRQRTHLHHSIPVGNLPKTFCKALRMLLLRLADDQI